MKKINFNVYKDTIEKLSNDIIISDSFNFLELIFKFSSDWEKYNIKKATFFSTYEDGEEMYEVDIIDNICIIPYEILKKTLFKNSFMVGVYGEIISNNVLEQRNVTNMITFTLRQGAYFVNSKNPGQIEPSAYNLYLLKLKEIFEENIKIYNENSIKKIDEYNNNAKLKKEEIDAVAKEVTQNKTDIEEIEKRVSASESNAKTSETNAKTSESNAQKSAENALQVLTNVTGIQEGINKTKGEIDTAKTSIDESVEEVNSAVTEATNQAAESKKQASIATTKANQTSADRTAVENAKNDVSAIKTSVEQIKADTEQIKTDTQTIKEETEQAKNETLEAKAKVENSLENERIESDKKYARAIESEEIVIEEYGQVELDEDGYMKEVFIESILPEITQDTKEENNKFDINTITPNNYIYKDTGVLSPSNVSNTSDYIEVEANKQYVLTFDYENLANSNTRAICYFDTEKNFLNGTTYVPTNKEIILSPSQDGYVRFTYDVNCTDIRLIDVGVSPSLEHPSPFKNIVGNVDVSNCKKNFLDMSKAKDGSSGGVTVTLNDDGTYSYVGTATQIAINIWFLGSFNNTKPIFTLKAGTYYIKDVILYNEHERLNDNESLITLVEDTKITGVRAAQAFVGQTYNEIKTPMIVRTESTEVSFEPYNGYNKKIELSEGHFLGSFNGYKNYIKDDRLKGRLKIFTLDGTEDWIYEQTDNKFGLYGIRIDTISASSKKLCTHYKNNSGGGPKNSFGLGKDYIRCHNDNNLTLEEWKFFLADQYSKGTPLQILYITSGEYEEDLSTENKSKINSLKVYNGINNICSNCKISFKANRVINKVIEDNNIKERKISDSKYAKALEGKVEDKQFTQIYAENKDIDNLVLKSNKITQETRNGYNKYNKNTSVVGKIDATGVVNSAIYDWETSDFIEIEELLEYLLSWKSTSSFFQVTLAYFNSDKELIDRIDIQQHNLYKYTFSTPENASYLRFSYSKVVNSVSANRTEIQLVEGTEEKSYEEYGASPSLNHPSEIKVTTEQNINVSKGNLLNVTIEDVIKNGVKAANNGDGSVNIKGTSTETSKNISFDLGTIELKKGESISVKPYGLEGLSTDIRFLTLVNAGVSTLIDFRAKDFATYTASEDVIGTFRFYVKPGQAVDITIKVMAVKGIKTVEEMPEFREYQSKDYKVVLPEGKFTGEYEGFENYIENKKLKGHLEILILDGNEEFYQLNNGTNYNEFAINLSKLNIPFPFNAKSLSNYFSNQENNRVIFSGPNYSVMYIRVPIEYNLSSLDKFKSKIKELYDAGTPLQILYITSEEFEEDLPEGTAPKIELMDDLNIVTIDNGTMSFEYNKSLVRVLEEKDQEIDSLKEQLNQKAGNSAFGTVKGANACNFSNGSPYATTLTLEQYKNVGNTNFIGKGTLENILAPIIARILALEGEPSQASEENTNNEESTSESEVVENADN